MKPLADQLAERAGTTIEDIARVFPVPKPRIRPEQLRNRIAGIRRAVNRGGLCSVSASRLAPLLNCSAFVFLHGYNHHHGINQQGLRETQSTRSGRGTCRGRCNRPKG